MGKAKAIARKAARADKRQAHRAARRDDGMLVRLLGRASELADQPPLILLSSATLAGGLLLRRPVAIRAGARMLASHLVATGAKTVLKNAVDRTRPTRALKDGHRLTKGNGAGDTSLNSFPSGHTAGAVAVAEAIATEAPSLAVPARLAAIGVGAVQPNRGKHYLSDVVAGAAIGWASERLVALGWRYGADAVERSRMKRWAQETAAHLR